MQISTILSQIDLGSYALPEFQRGYVWNRDQVRKLMSALYREYPIGELLVWVTETNESITKGDGQLTPGSVNLILDGQQRITTLYGIINGKPPKFFDGDERAFKDLYFNLDTEIFEFYAPMKMKGKREWISVTELMQKDVGQFIQDAMEDNPENGQFLMNHMAQLVKITNIKNINIHIEQVAGDNFNIDVVVDIFNNVNSGGTKLSKGDLALAKICGEWPQAREELKNILGKFDNAGYHFQMDWLLRCITVYLTNRPYFTELTKVDISDFKEALNPTEKMIGDCLDHIGSRLGLDNDKVLGGRYAIPTMIGYLRIKNNKPDSAEWDKLLFWYIHSFLWGRYSASTESVMAQDLNALLDGGDIDTLISMMRKSVGDMRLHPDDFIAWSTGARFYPLLYMLTRVCHARDFMSDLELSNAMLGKNSSLEVHHIFPKAQLYKLGLSKDLVNQLGNYAFLTKDTNDYISDREPIDYMNESLKKAPGALASHWVPMDKALWELNNYEDFLDERRKNLAEVANNFLDSLYEGTAEPVTIENYSERNVTQSLNTTSSEEDKIINNINEWMEQQGLDTGVKNYNVVDEDGVVLATIDLAWPNGIQAELSKPIALLLNETEDTHATVNQNGYIYFIDADSFKKYIQDKYL